MVKKTIKFIYGVLLYSFIWIYILFAKYILRKKFPKNIWIVGELPDMARDNGIAFYDYCMRHNKKNVFYIMKTTSSDYNNIVYKDNVIKYNSFRHHLYYLLCSQLITCFEGSLCISYKLEKIMHKMKITKFKETFLQHGITKDYVLSLTNKFYQPDAFITATNQEYDYIVKKFGHPKDVIKLTGMGRYDLLMNKSNKEHKKILIMPTWRRWIHNDFENTNFYKTYDSMLRKLDSLNLDIEINFYLHNNFQKYSDLFNHYKNINVLKSTNKKINDLFMECDLLITDYSSVAFDVAYLNKPIIYYQFDHDELFTKHYNEGYYNYETDGFGPVVYNESELFNKLNVFINNDFKNLDKYKRIIKNTFCFNDKNNCERIYKVIKEMDSEK